VLPAAQSHIAGDRKRSRWSKARLSLVVPIGAIVAVAIVCVVIAVLTSAKHADEVSLNREQLLLQEAVVGKGTHLLRVLESAAATPKATAELRNAFDAQWADRRIGKWLQSFYSQDIVVIVDGNDRITYSLFRSPGDAVAGDLGAQIKSSLDLLRGRLDAVPEHAVAVNARQDPANPGRSTALIQRFLDRPALVGAVAVGA
jgi:diguanylate cyclase